MTIARHSTDTVNMHAQLELEVMDDSSVSTMTQIFFQVARGQPYDFSLTELQRPEVVEVHDALDPSVCGNDDERGDLLLFHQSER